MEYRIRIIRPSESGQVRKLRLRALADAPEAMGGRYATTEHRSWPTWHTRTKSFAEGKRNVLFVAEHPCGRLMGSGGAIVTPSSSYGQVELMWMWVEVQNRRRGIARALLAEIELWGGKLDFSSLHLEVGEHNRIGRQFYAQCGYIPTDARKWLGREEERLIVMCKSLAV